ncbi:trifunctional dihydropteroate synthetase [Malassezia cuniculi]|uniref:Folic acid synthesis protein FOL1 n=1 Tax=Malassezia cuniculi TaxID=948313 RepID=A0AAF0ETB5_9BASI|nr:trifunctional dihydropteroate synthetase [Malassezia cuniculi]
MSTAASLDTVFVRDLDVRAHCGLDAWGRRLAQPVRITARATLDISRAGEHDHLPDSLNYGVLTRALERVSAEKQYDSVLELAEALAAVCTQECGAPKIQLHVDAQRSLLQADSVGAHITRPGTDVEIAIENLRVFGIIGINPWERESRQEIVVSLGLWGVDAATAYRRVARDVAAYTESSEFLTVESLATGIADVVLGLGASKVRVRVEKPSALMFAACPGVEIVRHAAAAPAAEAKQPAAPTAARGVRAAIALGANLGDRAKSIADAIAALDAHDAIRVTDTSFLYETKPMYYNDQPRFLNAACAIETTLAPHELLDVTQSIEVQLGRCKTGVPRNGPRAVDLDILIYGDEKVTDERLVIPHPRIAERAFVLLPLADIWTAEHPVLLRTPHELLGTLTHRGDYDASEIVRVTPICNSMWSWGQKTLVMGILNVTPNSFSDGGKYASLDDALAQATAMIDAGVDVIDIGGLSTAPGAPEIPADEERDRVVPVIKKLRASFPAMPISIDTFHASVAEAALDAGASIVNDISGGSRDRGMLPLVAARGCPIVLMHMRGDASTMTRLTDYDGDVVARVASELGERVRSAIDAGVSRYNIILDPGLGFAKTADDSVRLLRGLQLITGEHGARGGIRPGKSAPLASFPMLIGPSRKRFLGKLIGEQDDADPAGRLSATLAACTAGVATGCVDIVRVHDVREARDAVRTADALFR